MDQAKAQEFMDKLKALEAEYGVEIRAVIATQYLMGVNQKALELAEAVTAMARLVSQVPVELTMNVVGNDADSHPA